MVFGIPRVLGLRTCSRAGRIYSVLLFSSLVSPTLPYPYSTPTLPLLYPYSTLLYSTLLYSTLLYSTLLYSTLLYFTLLYSTLRLLYSTLLYSTVLYSTLCSFCYSILRVSICPMCIRSEHRRLQAWPARSVEAEVGQEAKPALHLPALPQLPFP